MSHIRKATFRALKACVAAFSLALLFSDASAASRPDVKIHNAPLLKMKEQAHYTAYIDENFTPQQRYGILLGLHEWVRATNGMITIEDRYGWTADEDMRDIPSPNRTGLKRCTSTIHIAHAYHDFPTVKEVEERKGPIDGLSYGDCDVKFMILVMDRISTHAELMQTTMHEMGHLLGLDHTNVPWQSVMYESDEKPAMCVTKLDLAQLCDQDRFDCDPEDLWPCESVPPTRKKSTK